MVHNIANTMTAEIAISILFQLQLIMHTTIRITWIIMCVIFAIILPSFERLNLNLSANILTHSQVHYNLSILCSAKSENVTKCLIQFY